MTEVSERVAATCPSCSPSLETVHEVLKGGGGQVTVRCTECDHVHKTTVEEEETVQRRVVVSQDDESFTAQTNAPAEETVSVGEEFLLDTEEAIMTVRVTSLEVSNQRRVEEAPVSEVETFWTRAVGNVSVNVTLHPADGKRDDTRSFTAYVPGDHEFEVGDSEELAGEEFTVESIMVTDDAEGYDYDKLDFDGDRAVAKDVKRLYARDESTTAWSAW